MSVPDAKRLKELETENSRLKKFLAEQVLENEAVKDAVKKNSGDRASPAWIGAAPDGSGLSERRPLAVMRMSASALRYAARPDRNVELRERILVLAHQHKRYGVGMIYLKLRQEGIS